MPELDIGSNDVPTNCDVQLTCCPDRKRPKQPSRWLVVGGGGYVGWHIADELGNKQSEPVCMVDLALNRPATFSDDELPKNTVFLKADVRDKQAVFEAFETFLPEVVLHICSYGMSGAEQLNKQLIEEINIDGLKNSLDACFEYNVERFVYISSDTVCLGRHEIRNGNEETPRIPLHKHCSHYALTKCVAEDILLAANGKVLRDDRRRLRVCILRSGGIYGVGELRHVPRFVAYLERGLICFIPNLTPATQDFINVRNLVQALVLAGDALSDERDAVAAGRVYCVSDGSPIGAFEFFHPLITGLGYSVPKIKVPATIMYFIAAIGEGIINIMPKFLGLKPFLTRQETLKACVVHYFSIDRARRELNYKPIGPPNNMKAVAMDYIKKGYKRPTGWNAVSLINIGVQILIVLLFGLFAVALVTRLM